MWLYPLIPYPGISNCNLHQVSASKMLKELSIKVLISCTGSSQDLLKVFVCQQSNSLESTPLQNKRAYFNSGAKRVTKSLMNVRWYQWEQDIHMHGRLLSYFKYPGGIQNKTITQLASMLAFLLYICCMYSKGDYCTRQAPSTQVQQTMLVTLLTCHALPHMLRAYPGM